MDDGRMRWTGNVAMVSLLNRRILIFGEVNSGKTTVTRGLTERLCEEGLSSRMAIIDMAPEVPREIAQARGLEGVGGRLVISGWPDVVYLAARLLPPRLMSKTEEEAMAVAAENKREIDGLFDGFQQSGRDILIINDITMYLQAGTARELLEKTKKAKTIVANGYYGVRLGKGTLSVREAGEMGILRSFFTHAIGMAGQSAADILADLT